MATNYPGSLDTGTEQPSPLASTEMDDAGFEHDVVHTNHSGAIIALETKVGTGSSTAVANSVLAGTGAGTSSWTTGTLANDISGNAATATSATSATTATNLSGGSVAATTLTASGDANFDSGTLFVDVSANNVGIGTTSPNHSLSFGSPANGTRSLALWENGTAFYGLGNDSNRLAFYASNSAGTAERMVINSSGNVGIGDTSPENALHVYRTGYSPSVNDDAALRVEGNWGGGIVMSEGTARMGIYAPGGNQFQVRTGQTASGGGTIGISQDASGNVGINDTTPSYKLDVNGTGRFTSTLYANGDLYVGQNGGSDSRIYFYDDNSNANRLFMWDDSANRFYFDSAIAISGTQLSDPGSANNLRVTTAYGYLDLGPQNSTYCHIYTDRAQFYTNKGFNSVPFIYWRNNSGIAGPLLDTSTGTGYRYVFQNQTFGTFYDFTSVRARKEQIVDVTEADAGRWIDALQPVTFIERWMGEGEEPADNKAFREADMQVGFIADDILANSDTTHFSQVIDNGEGGFDPSGWKWECVIATCVAELKASRGREAALEARVAALEAA